MDRIEYFEKRKNALRFIYNNRNGDISTFLTSYDEVYLNQFISLGFIEIDKSTNKYHITNLGKEYIEEFYNQFIEILENYYYI